MDSQFRPAALIPNYNNSRTLRDVLDRTLRVIPDALVVDDGSTDGSWDSIDSFWSRVRTLRHAVNLGKGKALRDGFALLAGAGFSHAITLDADGQHFPEDIPQFLRESTQFPEAVVVGQRDLSDAGAPLGSRFGLWWSNAALRLLRGVKLRDSQCGFRSYPLAAIARLDLRGDRYDFELEVLLEAARAGIHIRAVPVRVTYEPPGGRVSHFRPIRDFLQIAGRVARSLRRR